MNRYLLHGKLTAKDGNEEKLTSILLHASKLVSTAKGCILYVIGKDNNDKNAVWVTEIWDSKEDHDNSLKVDGVKELISQAIPILDGQPQKGQELEVLGGKRRLMKELAAANILVAKWTDESNSSLVFQFSSVLNLGE